MNKVFWCKLSELPENFPFDKGFSEERRQYINQINAHDRKRQSIIAWELLLRAINAVFPNYKPDFSVNERGKWFDKNSKVFFSISHSKNIVAVSLSDCETGLDIEKVTERILSLKNNAFFSDFTSENKNDEALELTKFWIKKECFYKSGLNGGEQIFTLEDGFDLYACCAVFAGGDFDINLDLIKINL